MSELLDDVNASAWVKEAINRHSNGIFGQIKPAVIWTDKLAENGEPIVPIDPAILVAKINSDQQPLLHNHDPGKPKGQILEAESFTSTDGKRFVVAILGFYAGGKILTFSSLGEDVFTPIPLPTSLPKLPEETFIEIAVDPRDVDAAWVAKVASDAPIRVEATELSHNAAVTLDELIRIGLPYVVVVWNPFVKAIATEAGKDTYKAMHEWLGKLLKRLQERNNPVLDIHTHQDGCQVSFLMRGNDPQKLNNAHNSLATAGVQAARLVAKLKDRGMAGRQLVYEFSDESQIWFPSFAVLNDDRIITDTIELIAIEQLPTGLSLGLSRGKSPVEKLKK
ncbi:hypothetical protein [Massilia sp. erpn]|uniref:hypothetical protein n=1 Tax=Massilia sp. erpn TaxID=2738142 RepID=UPI0021063D13|nr:hypothetical protein [Massilia sp. erpn]UTY57700.1 hypothetical protein HPQ68_11215 [Massilia sp. erpn]